VLYQSLDNITIWIILGVGAVYVLLTFRFAGRGRRSIQRAVRTDNEHVAVRKDILTRWKTIQVFGYRKVYTDTTRIGTHSILNRNDILTLIVTSKIATGKTLGPRIYALCVKSRSPRQGFVYWLYTI